MRERRCPGTGEAGEKCKEATTIHTGFGLGMQTTLSPIWHGYLPPPYAIFGIKILANRDEYRIFRRLSWTFCWCSLGGQAVVSVALYDILACCGLFLLLRMVQPHAWRMFGGRFLLLGLYFIEFLLMEQHWGS